MAKFFIDRPIFAWVIALFIVVLGLVSIKQLPVAQYPPVAPPTSSSAQPTQERRRKLSKTACCR